MPALGQDLRYAMRGLLQRPLLAFTAIVSIAIGIGANASIFSVVNALLLRTPVGVGEPERIIEIGRSSGGRGFDTFSYPELTDIAARVRAVDRVAGFRTSHMSYSATSGSESVFAAAVGAQYFDALGTVAQAGRFFAAEEDAHPGSGPVVVVSHRFWQEQLSGASDAVGRTIRLNRQPFTVIGITQPEFHGHMPMVAPDIYIPLTMFGAAKPGFDSYDSRESSWLTIVARLAPGSSVKSATTELRGLFTQLETQYPEVYAGRQRSAAAAALKGIPAGAHGIVAGFLGMLLGLTGLVLLTTCANVAGMLLARAAGREREIAIRLAIGSGRRALVQQLLIESLLLFAIGGAAGLAICAWGLGALSSIEYPVPVPLALDLAPDGRVLIFGLAITLVTGVLFGLAPALQSTHPNLVSALRNESSAGRSRGGRLRRAFIMSQVAFSLVLLIAAGLFLRSLQRASTIDRGFDPANAYIVSFDLSRDGYDESSGIDFLRRLTSELEATPGVTAAGVATDLPLDMGISETPAYPQGWADMENGMSSAFNRVSAGYFEATGMRTVAGRPFNDSDVATSQRVVVVSRSFAAQAWPGQNALGKTLRWGDPSDVERVVVGIVADSKNKSLMDDGDVQVYLPQPQSYEPAVTLVLRSTLPASEAVQVLRRTISRVDPQLAITPIQSLTSASSMGTLPQRIAAAITTVLGVLALVLSSLGIYGVIAYMVTQRTREIGVRMAIGAKQRDVLAMVLGSGLRLAVPGVGFGIVAAMGLSRIMKSFILGVPSLDPVTFFVVPLLLIVVVGLATVVPALRAAAVSPMTALRSE